MSMDTLIDISDKMDYASETARLRGAALGWGGFLEWWMWSAQAQQILYVENPRKRGIRTALNLLLMENVSLYQRLIAQGSLQGKAYWLKQERVSLSWPMCEILWCFYTIAIIHHHLFNNFLLSRINVMRDSNKTIIPIANIITTCHNLSTAQISTLLSMC